MPSELEERLREVEKMIRSTSGAETVTKKLTIQRLVDGHELTHRIYLIVGHHNGLLYYLDLFCDGSFDYSTRRLISMQCGLIREMLSQGVISLDEIVPRWRSSVDGAGSFEPQGWCEQLGRMVGSPLDAAARWMEMEIEVTTNKHR